MPILRARPAATGRLPGLRSGPGRHWAMALYHEVDGKRTIAFYTSQDLRAWEFASSIDGFFECPEIFELAVEGGPGENARAVNDLLTDIVARGVDPARRYPFVVDGDRVCVRRLARSLVTGARCNAVAIAGSAACWTACSACHIAAWPARTSSSCPTSGYAKQRRWIRGIPNWGCWRHDWRNTTGNRVLPERL